MTFDDPFHANVQRSVLGGFSSVLNSRRCVAGVTHLRPHDYGAEAAVCATINSYDAVSMYTKCLGKRLPCSVYVQREADNGFKPVLLGSVVGRDALLWLESRVIIDGHNIRHKANGAEKKLQIYVDKKMQVIAVDGFADAHRGQPATVYEYSDCGGPRGG